MVVVAADLRRLATRVVDLYAASVTINLADQGVLERDLVGRFTAATQASDAIPDWTRIANGALDEWERSHTQRGSRILTIRPDMKQISERPRSR